MGEGGWHASLALPSDPPLLWVHCVFFFLEISSVSMEILMLFQYVSFWSIDRITFRFAIVSLNAPDLKGISENLPSVRK